jgi:hypothetical protein
VCCSEGDTAVEGRADVAEDCTEHGEDRRVEENGHRVKSVMSAIA